MHSWGKFWTQKIQRDQKTQFPLLKSLEYKKGIGRESRYCACLLHSTPPEWWANHLNHPSSLTPGHTPPFIPHKEQAYPLPGEQTRESVACSCSPFCSRGPSPSLARNSSLAWISGLVSSQFPLFRRPRTLGQYHVHHPSIYHLCIVDVNIFPPPSFQCLSQFLSGCTGPFPPLSH